MLIVEETSGGVRRTCPFVVKRPGAVKPVIRAPGEGNEEKS